MRARDGRLKQSQDEEKDRMAALYKKHILMEPSRIRAWCRSAASPRPRRPPRPMPSARRPKKRSRASATDPSHNLPMQRPGRVGWAFCCLECPLLVWAAQCERRISPQLGWSGGTAYGGRLPVLPPTGLYRPTYTGLPGRPGVCPCDVRANSAARTGRAKPYVNTHKGLTAGQLWAIDERACQQANPAGPRC